MDRRRTLSLRKVTSSRRDAEVTSEGASGAARGPAAPAAVRRASGRSRARTDLSNASQMVSPPLMVDREAPTVPPRKSHGTSGSHVEDVPGAGRVPGQGEQRAVGATPGHTPHAPAEDAVQTHRVRRGPSGEKKV